MGTLSSYSHVSTLAGTERVPVVVTPGVAGGNAYITATEMAAALALLNTTTAWTGVTFSNSWVNFGAPNQVCQYQKVGDRVYLRGIMKSGTLSAIAFTLPAGFRPPASLVKAAVANGAFSLLSIDAAGTVTPIGASNVYQSIDCDFSVTA